MVAEQTVSNSNDKRQSKAGLERKLLSIDKHVVGHRPDPEEGCVVYIYIVYRISLY